MKAIYDNISKHLPVYIGIILVVANALIDAGYLTLPENVTVLVNAVLAALGIGVLHLRQQASLK